MQEALLGAVQLHADGLTGAATAVVEQVKESIVKMQGSLGATVETAAAKSADVERALQQQADGLTGAATTAIERFKAAVGGPIALLRHNDRVTIDATRRRIDVELSAAELRRRARALRPRKPYAVSGVLAKYARVVSSASRGAVTDGDGTG